MAEFTGTVKLKDEHGLRTTKTCEIFVDEGIHVTVAAQVMAAYAELAQFAGKLDDVSDLLVEDASLNVSVLATVAGLKAAPLDQGAAEGAWVLLAVQGTDKLHPYWIPGASAGIFLSDFKTVDINDAALQDFFEEFDDPLADIGVVIKISDGQEIDQTQGAGGLVSGYYATKHRSGR